LIALSDLAYISLIALGVGDLFAFYVFFPFFYLPRLLKAMLTALPSLILQGLTTMQTSDKMKDLGKKGVEARQAKAEQQAVMALAIGDDVIKAGLVELAPALAEGIAGQLGIKIPAGTKSMLVSRVQKGLLESEINFTNALAPPFIKWLDERVTQFSGGKVHLAEELKALGVLSNAEKVAE